MRQFFTLSMLFCLLLSGVAYSQVGGATLLGTIADTAGMPIPGTTVTATNLQTGVVVTIITNTVGEYQFTGLPAGSYVVRAELPGFQTQTFNNVELRTAQSS